MATRVAPPFRRSPFNPYRQNSEILMRVLIENSAGNGSTSLKHARNYVRRRRAEWVKNSAVPTIRFIESDSRHRQVVVKCVTRTAGAHYQAGLDTMAEPYQIQGAGVVGDVYKLLTIGILGDWAWSSAVFVRPTQNASNNEKPEVRARILRARYTH